MEWTTSQVETLTKLWQDGVNTNEIAVRLGGGATKNAVIGKAGRLKLGEHINSKLYKRRT